MGALGTKLRRWGVKADKIAYWCPGCDGAHSIGVDRPQVNGAQWTWDGNVEHPTFSPSINVGPGTVLQCHHFVRGGRIEFQSDCWHSLAGQTVDLPAWPECESV